MSIVVQDSKGELDAYISEQEGAAEGKAPAKGAEKPPAEAAEKPNGEGKPVDEPEDDPDDQEGEDGLTARQKRELSTKMLKAIGKKHREMKEAEEFAAAQYSERRLAEARAEQLEQEIRRVQAEMQAKAQPVQDPNAGKPKRADFEDDSTFQEALIEWNVDQRMRQKAAEEAKASREREQAEIFAVSQERIAKAIKLVPDYEETAKEADQEVPPAISTYLERAEMIAELCYHFAKNPEVLERLRKLPPVKQLVEIGKIESTLKPFGSEDGSKDASTNGATPSSGNGKLNGQQASAPATPSASETGTVPSKARTSAPVIKPLGSQSMMQAEKDERDMNTREAIAAWQRERKANLGLRKRH